MNRQFYLTEQILGHARKKNFMLAQYSVEQLQYYNPTHLVCMLFTIRLHPSNYT